jgi:hypothetical protein
VAVAIPKPRIKKTVIKYYPAAVITELRVFIKAKLIIFINTFYIFIKSKEDIETKDTQKYRYLKKLEYF